MINRRWSHKIVLYSQKFRSSDPIFETKGLLEAMLQNPMQSIYINRRVHLYDI